MDFSYNNVNVQNIKDAFERYSDVVVSDFDPFSDRRVLELLFIELKKSGIYQQFFGAFLQIFTHDAKANDPESYLELESQMENYIAVHPEQTADAKVKAAQYFTILNRIEYVIALDDKYKEPSFLAFLRLFNRLYNQLHRSDEVKDPIEVYFDNQIGIIEVQTQTPKPKKKQEPKVAAATGAYKTHSFNVLEIIKARNKEEDLKAQRIQAFKTKIEDFFQYIKNAEEGKRLIIKINSQVREDEIYDDFARIYRKYKLLHRQTIGDAFFNEIDDLVNKLCDDFEQTVRRPRE